MAHSRMLLISRQFMMSVGRWAAITAYPPADAPARKEPGSNTELPSRISKLLEREIVYMIVVKQQQNTA